MTGPEPRLLDIDEPAEVTATAAKFADAITSVDRRVAAIVAELVVSERRMSPLDTELVRRLDWIKGALGNALADNAESADGTYRRVLRLAEALAAADAESGARIRLSGSR